MNQITGAGHNAGGVGSQSLPPSRFDRLNRLDDGFSPSIPGQTRGQWLEQARTSDSPEMRAFYNELVTLAGGRTDDAALNQVIDRYQALQNASTASEVQAAERGWLDQIGTMLNRFDPIDRLLDTVQPQLADLARGTGLGETAWGGSLQGVLDTLGSLSAFREGMRAGALAGAQEMVVGTLELAGRTLQYGANSSVAGHAGDALRGMTGALPGAIDAVVPSAQRGAATSATLTNIGRAVTDYIGAVASDPGRLRGDIMNAIDAQWSGLEASHAAAAAQGPQAEARWWGETVGRVSFEVAATFVPIAGQAGKVGTAARVGDAAGDAARLAGRADDVADAARLANGVDDLPLNQRLPDPEPVDRPNTPIVGPMDEFARIAGRIDVELDHILMGEINRRGRAVGFHSRPDSIDPPNARMTERLMPPDANGVYTGKVEVLNQATGAWVEKRGFSSFYPDNLSAVEIEAAIRNAYADALRNDRVLPNGGFAGSSGLGFGIEGFARNGAIQTAYPVRE